MGQYSIKLPDVGEGVAEAELVEWKVKVGDVIREDDIIGAVMTDKATVEIPSAVSGKVLWLGADVGQTVAVGSEIIRLEVEGEGNAAAAKAPPAAPKAEQKAEPAPKPVAKAEAKPEPKPEPARAAEAASARSPQRFSGSGPLRPEGEKPLASPSVRQRARDAGIDLRQVRGSGPAGRITHDDLDSFYREGPSSRPSTGLVADTSVNEVKVIGLRRKIAERMTLSKSRIPHITIVEEVDVTELEDLRARLQTEYGKTRAKLTLLPFLMRTIVKAVREQPGLNAHYDDEANIVRQYGGVHIGIAAQTPGGLVVPVVHHAEALGLWESAAEVLRLAEAARSGTAKREELSGSTITITSLGPLGAIATTPIINYPEVAIIGVNRMAVRPMWNGNQFVPRKMMNLSCSFDHRVIDGWDAAVFVQRLKTLLETPAMIFVEG